MFNKLSDTERKGCNSTESEKRLRYRIEARMRLRWKFRERDRTRQLQVIALRLRFCLEDYISAYRQSLSISDERTN